MVDHFAIDHGLPCRNPNCKSHGVPHYGCKCWSGSENSHGMGAGENQGYANGGCVRMEPHKPECEFYAEGGKVAAPPAQANPATTLGHSSVHHGLLSLLKDVGNVTRDPEKHSKSLDKAKEHLSAGNHDKAVSALHGTPVVGGIGQNDLSAILPHLSGPIMSGESNPGGMRAAVDYLHSAIKGHRKLDDHMSKLFGPTKAADRIKPDEASREELKEFLQDAKIEPQRLLDIGGSIGHYLPDHNTQLGALAATAVNHFDSLRPKTPQGAPLDEPMEPDQMAMQNYNRHLDIAQNPSLVIQHMRDGTLMPQDLQTLQTLYPALHKSMQDKAGEALINAKTKGTEIPYHQKMGLSMLLGQPLDSTFTPSAMQAIISSAGSQQMQNQQSGQKKSQNKPTKAVIDQFDKVDELYQTPLESRQIDKKQ